VARWGHVVDNPTHNPLTGRRLALRRECPGPATFLPWALHGRSSWAGAAHRSPLGAAPAPAFRATRRPSSARHEGRGSGCAGGRREEPLVAVLLVLVWTVLSLPAGVLVGRCLRVRRASAHQAIHAPSVVRRCAQEAPASQTAGTRARLLASWRAAARGQEPCPLEVARDVGPARPGSAGPATAPP
jgi:hypothetical protein